MTQTKDGTGDRRGTEGERGPKDEAGQAGGGRHDMVNQTAVLPNPISNATSRTGNQAEYEPGQPVREANRRDESRIPGDQDRSGR